MTRQLASLWLRSQSMQSGYSTQQSSKAQVQGMLVRCAMGKGMEALTRRDKTGLGGKPHLKPHPNRSSKLLLRCLHGRGSAPCIYGRARPGARGSEPVHFNSSCQRSIHLMQRGNSCAAVFREKRHHLLWGLGHH